MDKENTSKVIKPNFRYAARAQETKELSVTTSVGVSIFPKDGADTDTLIKHADVAMYCSKGLGRNKYTCYGLEMSDSISKKKEPR